MYITPPTWLLGPETQHRQKKRLLPGHTSHSLAITLIIIILTPTFPLASVSTTNSHLPLPY
jgi:hypothetical protein